MVILDIFLKGDTSFSLLKKIKEEKPDTVVLMFSGHNSEKFITEAKKLGADGFVHKPFHLKYLDNFLMPKIESLSKKLKDEK